MSALEIVRPLQGLRLTVGAPEPRLRGRGGIVHVNPRTVGQWEDDPFAGHRRIRANRSGHGLPPWRGRRRRRTLCRTESPSHWLRASGRESLPASFDRAERRLRSAPAGSARKQGYRAVGDGRARWHGAPLSSPTLWRAATARRSCAGARYRTGARAVGRAILFARCESSGNRATRCAAGAARGGHDHDPRHPRSGRGALARGSGGNYQ